MPENRFELKGTHAFHFLKYSHQDLQSFAGQFNFKEDANFTIAASQLAAS